MKTLLKTMAFGREPRPFRIHHGLARGLRFQLDPSCDSQRIFGLAEWELGPAFRALLPACESVADIGAGLGWYSLIAAHSKNRPQITAVEADPEALEQLVVNADLNGMSAREQFTLHARFAGSQDLTLDETLESSRGPTLIKMDIEGAEEDALRSGAEHLQAHPIAVIVETHSRKLEVDCVAWLQELGFDARIVSPAWWRAILPENRPAEHNRWFVATNAPFEQQTGRGVQRGFQPRPR